MTARTRLWVLVVSTPVIAFTLIGGYLGQAMTRDETLRNLRVFEDVMQLVVDNYVEDVDVKKAMRGAMRGLTDGLDLDSSFLTPELVKAFESGGSKVAFQNAQSNLLVATDYGKTETLHCDVCGTIEELIALAKKKLAGRSGCPPP